MLLEKLLIEFTDGKFCMKLFDHIQAIDKSKEIDDSRRYNDFFIIQNYYTDFLATESSTWYIDYVHRKPTFRKVINELDYNITDISFGRSNNKIYTYSCSHGFDLRISFISPLITKYFLPLLSPDGLRRYNPGDIFLCRFIRTIDNEFFDIFNEMSDIVSDNEAAFRNIKDSGKENYNVKYILIVAHSDIDSNDISISKVVDLFSRIGVYLVFADNLLK